MAFRTAAGGQVEVSWRARGRRMLSFDMAFLTQSRTFGFKQSVVLRTMGQMAIQTVFAHRGMFPEEGALFVGMTREAIFINRGLF